MELLVALTLMTMSIEDIKKKSITVIGPLIISVMALVGCAVGKILWQEILLGIIPGLVCYGLAVLTAESIGKGDGLTIIALGAFVGLRDVLCMLMLSTFLVAIVGIVLISTGITGKNYKMPFIPYLCGVFFMQMMKGLV